MTAEPVNREALALETEASTGNGKPVFPPGLPSSEDVYFIEACLSTYDGHEVQHDIRHAWGRLKLALSRPQPVAEAVEAGPVVMHPFLPEPQQWPEGKFWVHDPEPENHHSALYLVCPGGFSLNVSCDAREGVDIARAAWMAAVLNNGLERDILRSPSAAPRCPSCGVTDDDHAPDCACQPLSAEDSDAWDMSARPALRPSAHGEAG